jgi:hypothetical protein
VSLRNAYPSSLAAAVVTVAVLVLSGSPAAAAADPGTGNLTRRAQVAYESSVPSAWRAAAPLRVSAITGGYTSLSYTDGRTSVSRYHATRAWSNLRSVMAHEWGHHLAFRYGTQAYLGAPPAGFPQRTSATQETFADCVSWALIGTQYRYGNVPPCNRTAMTWTKRWLATGPGSHRPTR